MVLALDPTHTQRAVVGTLHRRRTSEYSSPRPIASPYPQVKNAERRFEAEKEKAKKWALQATGMTDAVAKAKDFKQNLEQAKKDAKEKLIKRIRASRAGRGMRYFWGLLPLETKMKVLSLLYSRRKLPCPSYGRVVGSYRWAAEVLPGEPRRGHKSGG